MNLRVIIFSLFIISAVYGTSQNNDLSKSIRIHGTSLEHNTGDTFTVRIWKHIFGREDYSPYREYKSAVNANGKFEFLINDVDELSFISLGRDKIPNSKRLIEFMERFVCEPGDDIQISIGKIMPAMVYSSKPDSSIMHEKTILKSITFAGKGAPKYEAQTAIRARRIVIRDSIFSHYNKMWKFPPAKEDSLEYREYYLSTVAKLREAEGREIYLLDSIELQLLEGYQSFISKSGYDLIKAEIIGRNEYTYSEAYLFAYMIRKFISNTFKDSIRTELKKVYDARPLPFDPSSIMDLAKSKSHWFRNYLRDVALIRNNYNYDSAFMFLIHNYKGQLKEMLLTSFLSESNNITQMTLLPAFLDSAIAFVKNKDYLEVLYKVKESQLVGNVAYNFFLPDINGKKVRLSDFKGKVVFIDFWYTGCTGCKQFFTKDVQIAEMYFKDNSNVAFVTISCDGDYDNWVHSLKQGGYTSNKAVNLYTEGKGFDHIVIDKFMVQGAPRPIIIGKDGKIFCNDTAKMKMFSDGKALIGLINEALRK